MGLTLISLFPGRLIGMAIFLSRAAVTSVAGQWEFGRGGPSLLPFFFIPRKDPSSGSFVVVTTFRHFTIGRCHVRRQSGKE